MHLIVYLGMEMWFFPTLDSEIKDWLFTDIKLKSIVSMVLQQIKMQKGQSNISYLLSSDKYYRSIVRHYKKDFVDSVGIVNFYEKRRFWSWQPLN